MFNFEKIESIFTYDIYGFTKALIDYIHFERDEFPDKVKLDHILECAYLQNSSYDQKIIKNTLFLIYQSLLVNPPSESTSRGYQNNILEIKNKIEHHWLTTEFSKKITTLDMKNTSQ